MTEPRISEAMVAAGRECAREHTDDEIDVAEIYLAMLAHDDTIRELVEAGDALRGLVAGVEKHCNEPGGGGISGYLGARLSDARVCLKDEEG